MTVTCVALREAWFGPFISSDSVGIVSRDARTHRKVIIDSSVGSIAFNNSSNLSKLGKCFACSY